MARRVVNTHLAKSMLSKLLRRVEAGEEIVIARNGTPVAKLVRYDSREDEPRKPGGWRDQVVIADDFDDLPADLANAFAGKDA